MADACPMEISVHSRPHSLHRFSIAPDMPDRHADDELDALLASGESDCVAFAENPGDGQAIRRNICALANDLPGHRRAGVLFIGVRDDGACAQQRIGDELLKKLAGMGDDGSILPKPSLTVRKHRMQGGEAAAMAVQPAPDAPVRYKGRVYVRIGPTVRAAAPADERVLGERRRGGERCFDSRPCREATLDALDMEHVRSRYLPSALAQDVLERSERPLEQQLHGLRLLQDGRPTWASLLAFAKDPQNWLPGAYVQFLRIDGNAITDPIRSQKTLAGKLEDVLLKLNDLLEINVSVRTDIRSGARERRFPDYPLEALRQLAGNAVMHRDYEGANAPVRIYWMAERIDIASPGGLYGSVTPDNFWSGQTDYRNPLVSEILRNLGFAQRFGYGVPLVRKALADNGNPPPVFDFQPASVRATIHAAGTTP